MLGALNGPTNCATNPAVQGGDKPKTKDDQGSVQRSGILSRAKRGGTGMEAQT